MRRTWLLLVAIGCTPAAASREVAAPSQVTPRLLPPDVLDLDAPGAPYRNAVAVQIQPPWTQFLEDCRLRLPPAHPLNNMSLTTFADLTIDRTGAVIDVGLSGSGSADFDRAVRQVLRDAAPLPRPPAMLWSDDDRVHLRWLFARDRRQAGPATAALVDRELPVREVVARLIASGDLTRAARRVEREPANAARDAATTELMIAGLREALASGEGSVQRAAIDAIGAGNIGTLADEIYKVYASTSDAELRFAAWQAAVAMGDHSVVNPLRDQLRGDIRRDRKLALLEARGLIALDARDAVLEIVASELNGSGAPNAIALHVLGLVELDATPLMTRLASWQKSGDARIRAGACVAHTRGPTRSATVALAAGLKDRDAKVRAACLDTVTTRMAFAKEAKADTYVGAQAVDRVIDLVRDRDVLVRAAAIGALAAVQAESPYEKRKSRKQHVLDPKAFPDLSADPAAEVRVAYLRALAALSTLRPLDGGPERVRALLDDRDAEVRAAAWDTFVVLLGRAVDKIAADPLPDDFTELITRAKKDQAPQVRRAVIGAINDEVALVHLSGSDDDAEVRTRALVRVAELGGRRASAELLVGRFATATPGSAERVRAALAWHLAR